VRKGAVDKLTPAERCGIGVQGNTWETILLKSLKSEVSVNHPEGNAGG